MSKNINFYITDNVVFVPSGATGTVFSIEMHHRSQPSASTGDNVGLNIKKLDKTRMPKRGDVMMLASEKNPYPVHEFTALINVQQHPGELKPTDENGNGGFSPDVKVRTAHSACQLYRINWKVGKSTGGQKAQNPPFISQGEQAEVVFRPKKPLYVEPFDKSEGLARIAIMDSNSLVALGKVTAVIYLTPELALKLKEEAATKKLARDQARKAKK